MGEIPVTEIARHLSEGRDPGEIRDVPGTCWKTHDPSNAADALVLPSYEEVRADKKVFAKAFKTFYIEQNHARGSRLIQDRGAWHVVQNRPARPMTEKEMDKVYNLPYARAAHPSYDEAGGVPALEEVRFSIQATGGASENALSVR